MVIDTSATETISFSQKAAMYKVQFEDGWSLVSSELAAPPILAYCDHGTFPDNDDMPDGLRWFLEMYEDNLAYLRESSINRNIHEQWNTLMTAPQKTVESTYEVVLDKMTHFIWGQSKNNSVGCSPSYNQTCPSTSNGNNCYHAPAGCIAVAMAGIMYYYKWPHAVDAPDYYLAINSETHFYDWENIPDYLDDNSSDYEAFQVNQILRDCGKSVDMIYGDNGSTSSSILQKAALKRYFKFSCSRKLKSSHALSWWLSTLKKEIDEGRPVIYRGTGSNGGHSFILMGYNSNDYFRFNFGWNGTSNNTWLTLDSVITFTNFQKAIIGIKPNPDCDGKTISSKIYDDDFYLVNGGTINISNTAIENGVSGIIYAGQQIRLTNGFHAKSGSNVHLAIKDIPECDIEPEDEDDEDENDDENTSVNGNRFIPRRVSFAINTLKTNNLKTYPNPVSNILNIKFTKELSKIMIYSLSGQPVLQTSETEINVTALSTGMYLVRAITTAGEQLQAKFIKQ